MNTSRHNLGLYRCVVCTAQYTAPSTGAGSGGQEQQLRTAVENALAAVVMRHGILRAGVAGEDTHEPVFTHLRTIDLREMIEWKELPGESSTNGGGDDEYMQALLRSTEERHDRLWEDLARRPGWKLIVHVHQRRGGGAGSDGRLRLDISLAFHHIYADGQSVFLFHRDLVQALSARGGPPPPAELHDHVLHLPRPPAIPPPCEALVPFTLSWGFLLRLVWWELVWKKLAPAWLAVRFVPAPAALSWTAGPVTPDPHRARLRLVRVRPDALAAVLAACRRRQTTLTPLLHALAIASLAARLPASVAPAFAPTTAINLRRWAKSAMAGEGAGGSNSVAAFDPENDLQNLVTGHLYNADAGVVSALRAAFASTSTSPSSSSSSANPATTEKGKREEDPEEVVWRTAGRIGEDLRAKVATLPRDDIAGLTGMVSDWRARLTGQFGQRKDRTWECSNAGSMRASDAEPGGGGNGDGHDCWRIERVLFSQGATPVGPAFALNVAGVEGRGLWIVVSWQDSNVEDALLEGLAADLQAWFDALGAAGRFGMFDGRADLGRSYP